MAGENLPTGTARDFTALVGDLTWAGFNFCAPGATIVRLQDAEGNYADVDTSSDLWRTDAITERLDPISAFRIGVEWERCRMRPALQHMAEMDSMNRRPHQ